MGEKALLAGSAVSILFLRVLYPMFGVWATIFSVSILAIILFIGFVSAYSQ
ncbi:hypothetical protein JXM83_05185 [Candidatus Woesearchaeota archaeon]|nr:hypothetical protein [Candidatus Woesearchaeota archaeon]